jgi:hypothetical protein
MAFAVVGRDSNEVLLFLLSWGVAYKRFAMLATPADAAILNVSVSLPDAADHKPLSS